MPQWDDFIWSDHNIENRLNPWKGDGESIVFTNGCFDLIHRGHLEYLSKASELGDRLIIGLNSDSSVQRLKGPVRPIKDEQTRAALLASLRYVDAVILFYSDTPESLIHRIRPDVLVKGGDWKKDEIAGADFVTSNGGTVETIPYISGQSTTELIERIVELFQETE